MVQTAIYGIKEADSPVLNSSPDLKNKCTSQQSLFDSISNPSQWPK